MKVQAIRGLAFVQVLTAALAAAASQVPAVVQRAPTPDPIARIFSGELSPHFPPPPQWFQDGRSYFLVEPAKGAGSDVVKYDTATGQRVEVLITAAQLTPPGTRVPLEIEGLSWSPDHSRVLVFTNTRRVWRTNSRGDYWLLDRKTSRLRRIGGEAPEASLMYAAFNPDATKVAYVLRNDIHVEDVPSGAIRRLTRDGSDVVVNGAPDWVNEEELGLQDCFRWSPDGKRIAFWQFDVRGVGIYPLHFSLGTAQEIVTRIPYPGTGPYPLIVNVPYPLAGTANSAVRAGVVDAEGGSVRWLQLPGDPRQHYIARLQWADTGTVLVQQLNRLQNTVTYLLGDTRSGQVREMWRDRDEAFIGVGAEGLPEARQISGGSAFLVMSERDGWLHVYRVSREGRETLVTRGNMDVLEVSAVDEKSGWLYLIASPQKATQRYLYRAPLDGTSEPVRVTPPGYAGTNRYDISPDGGFALHTYASFDDPGLRQLITLPDHSLVRPAGDAAKVKAKLAPLLTPPVEYFQADAGDGVIVDGYLIRPPGFDLSRKYPVLVYVYGEPAQQTVLDTWGGIETLYHRHLASLGYLVVSFDNAGTPAPRGRAWRKGGYGAFGVLSSRQQAAALRSFARRHAFVDLDRVAVWGWSGGGTSTLNLLFRFPELYKVGMAVAPVPDQRLYDTIYQERYMGLPSENVEGYRQGSAINFADRLTGDLLIVHGSGDDNVHYQGSELLVNRLIELGKPFEFMTYPGRTHSISEGPGTTVHLFRLLTRYLTEHLPAGPR